MSFVNILCNHLDLQVAEHVDLTRKYLAGSPKISFTILLRWVAAYITKNYSFIRSYVANVPWGYQIIFCNFVHLRKRPLTTAHPQNKQM